MGNYVRRGYHSTFPAWRSTQLKGQYIGIELEVYHPNHYRDALAALPNVRKNQRAPITEEDGSLDDYKGVEIIFPPYKYAQLKNHRSFFHTSLAALQKAGAHGRPGYGMHMNVNTGGWSEDKIATFVLVVGSIPVRNLANVGGRQMERTYIHSWHELMYDAYGRVEAKEGRLECRFPQSDTNSARVMVLVDFINMVEKYASSKKVQSQCKTLVRDRRVSTAGMKAVHDEIYEGFTDWLDAQSTKNTTAKAVLEVMENGEATLKTVADSGVYPAPDSSKPWCASNPGNIGKDGPHPVDEDGDYYDDEDCYYD